MLKQIKNKKKKGFTLVELIVVIAILLVLAVLAVVAYSNITASARAAAIQSDANTVVRALNIYNSVCPPDNRITSLTADTTGLTGYGSSPGTYAEANGSTISVSNSTIRMSVSQDYLGLLEPLNLEVTIDPARWSALLGGGDNAIISYNGNTGPWVVHMR